MASDGRGRRRRSGCNRLAILSSSRSEGSYSHGNVPGVGVLRLRRMIRFANRSAALRMTNLSITLRSGWQIYQSSANSLCSSVVSVVKFHS